MRTRGQEAKLPILYVLHSKAKRPMLIDTLWWPLVEKLNASENMIKDKDTYILRKTDALFCS